MFDGRRCRKQFWFESTQAHIRIIIFQILALALMVTRCLDIWSSSWLRGLRETFVRVKCRCRTEGRRSTRVSCLAWSGSGTWAWRDSGNKEGRVTEAESQRHAPLLYIWCSISFVNFQKLLNSWKKCEILTTKKRYDFQDFFCQCNYTVHTCDCRGILFTDLFSPNSHFRRPRPLPRLLRTAAPAWVSPPPPSLPLPPAACLLAGARVWIPQPAHLPQ